MKRNKLMPLIILESTVAKNIDKTFAYTTMLGVIHVLLNPLVAIC